MDEDISYATLNAFLSLLRVLHRRKVIDANDVVADFGNGLDFANAEKIDVPDPNAQLQVYRLLERFARLLAATDGA